MAAKMVTNHHPVTAEAPKKDATMFEAFQWFEIPIGASTAERRAADLATRTRDVAHGLATVLQMLEQDQLGDGARGDDEPKLMNDFHASNLQRLSITVLQMLGEKADEALNDMYQAAEKARAATH